MGEMTSRFPVIFVLSDSTGETGEFIVRAAASQFIPFAMEIKRVSYVDDTDTINEVIAMCKEMNGMIAYTLVKPLLREYTQQRATEEEVTAIDLIGPLMDLIADKTGQEPKNKPGLIRQLDDEYFKRVEAVEFAVKYDDGRGSRGLTQADIVLVGVSRTSKTPLSMYLAHKMIKVANIPLVPEVTPPDELFQVPKDKIIGLTITTEKLFEIRKERLHALGLPEEANYANRQRIEEELRFSDQIMKKLGCFTIDVSHKAVEETAGIVMEKLRKK